MILGLTGTHIPFDRLIKALDNIAQEYQEEVIVQAGPSRYPAKKAKLFSFKPQVEIQALIQKAEVIVSHGGCGIIRDVLEKEKPLIVVPRLKKFQEHCNDHQLDIAEHFAEQQLLVLCQDTKLLWDEVRACRSQGYTFSSFRNLKTSPVEGIIDSFLATAKG